MAADRASAVTDAVAHANRARRPLTPPRTAKRGTSARLCGRTRPGDPSEEGTDVIGHACSVFLRVGVQLE